MSFASSEHNLYNVRTRFLKFFAVKQKTETLSLALHINFSFIRWFILFLPLLTEAVVQLATLLKRDSATGVFL